jgi:pimeloyl-ACP methyl ester carboxylesterase
VYPYKKLPASYLTLNGWRNIQQFFPETNRISRELFPDELFIKWKSNRIHIDYYTRPDAPAKIIMLHGIGGNGRLLSFMAIPMFRRGFDVICPDLPGYGISKIRNKKTIHLREWVNLVDHIIEQEYAHDKRPVFLFGFSLGGTLAWHVASANAGVKGIIATCLPDQRIARVRDFSATNKLMSRLGPLFISILNLFAPGFLLPMNMVTRMRAITNHPEMSRELRRDPYSSGAKVPLRLLHSILKAKPVAEAQNFSGCPVALLHPENDRWTPLEISRITFDKFPGEKELHILENAGHFPIEQPGLKQLEEYAAAFVNHYTKTFAASPK